MYQSSSKQIQSLHSNMFKNQRNMVYIQIALFTDCPY